MPHMSLRLTGQLLGRIDELVGEGKFASRSEAVREAIIEMLVRFDTERLSKEADRS